MSSRRILRFGHVLVLASLAALGVTNSHAQATRLNLHRSFPVLQTGNLIWIGTPDGLYQYDRPNDTFKRFAFPGKTSMPGIRMIFSYKEWLWCVLDSGLAALHLRLNDWLTFDASNGLPSAAVTGIAGQDDYVWISTMNGFARFDLLTEQWETFDRTRGLPDSSVGDIAASGKQIWLIHSGNFPEYDPQFEKWRHFSTSGDSAGVLTRLFLLGEELWLVSGKGLIRFNPQLQRQQLFLLPYLHEENLLDLYLEESRMWAVSKHGLYTYEQQSGVWREFEGNSSLGLREITAGHVGQEQIWISTAETNLVWDRQQKTWEIQDYSSGLSATGYAAIYSDGELTFMLTPDGVEYRRSSRDPWRQYRHEETSTEGAGAGFLKTLLDNPKGGHVKLGQYTWLWQGTRVTWLQNFKHDLAGRGSFEPWEKASASRYDVKSQIDFTQGRRITGFYNNIDYDEPKYGARYRGNDSDPLREVTAGDFRRDISQFPFGQTSEMYGGTLWLQAGEKTERFKRSLVTLRGTSAEVRSTKTYETVQGTTDRFAVTRRDNEYIRNIFFGIPGVNLSAIPDWFEVYVDDMAASTNSTQTLVGTVIAGLPGDFDRFKPIEDYVLSARLGLLRFLKPVLPQWSIVVRFGTGDQTHEAILQGGNVLSAVRENVYSVGVQRILPFSFRLQVLDTTGASVPLSTFGLDNDHDGMVDAEWIDFQEGIITFPSPRPFPGDVYAQTNPRTLYSLLCSGQSELTIVQLRHQNLVRGTETVWLDGVSSLAGNDYVLDYTNGTLIFVREGILNPDTRIEIEYEYFEPTGKQLTAGSVQFAPSDRFYAQGEWQKLSSDSSHLLTAHSEIRQSVGTFDLRVVPGLAYQTGEHAITGTAIEALLGSSWLRVQSKFENYSQSYRNLYRPRAVIGEVHSRLNLSSTVDLRDDLRIAAEWKSTKGFARQYSPASTPSDRSVGASMLFHRQDMPGIQLSYFSGDTHLGDSAVAKHFVQSVLEYQLPPQWSQAMFLRSLRIEQFLRYGRQTEEAASSYSRNEFLQAYFRLNALVTEQIQTGLFYRRSTVDDASQSGRRSPLSSSERFLTDIAVTEWRAVQLNVRGENTLQQYAFKNSAQNRYALRQSLQGNLRVLPGEFWSRLSPLFFEISHAQSLEQSGVQSAFSSSYLWRVSRPLGDKAASYTESRTSYIKNEFRPSAFWFLQSSFEWTRQEVGNSSTSIERRSWKLNEKADIKLGTETRVVIQYRQAVQDQGYDRLTRSYEPSVWVEQRWTPDLTGTGQLLFRRTTYSSMENRGPGNDWQSTADVVWRKSDLFGMRYGEIRQSFLGGTSKSSGLLRQNNYTVSSSTSLDLYLLHSTIVRIRFDLNRYVDLVDPSGTATTLTIDARLTLQL